MLLHDRFQKNSTRIIKTDKVLAIVAAAALTLGFAHPAQARVGISFGIGIGLPVRVFCGHDNFSSV